MTTKDAIIKDLVAARRIFDSCGLSFVLYHGCLLGLVKYGGIMEWDTDIDLAVVEVIDDRRKEELVTAFQMSGFKGGRKRKSTMRFHRNVDVDIFFFHLDGVWYRLGEARRFKRCYPRGFFDNLRHITFLGEKFLIPMHVDDYLEWEYGPNWQTEEHKNKTKWKAMVAKRRAMGHW